MVGGADVKKKCCLSKYGTLKTEPSVGTFLQQANRDVNAELICFPHVLFLGSHKDVIRTLGTEV